MQQNEQSNLTLTHITYLCFILGAFLYPIIIVAMVLNYFNEDKVAGTWIHTHFAWQARTFWKALIWYLIGLILCLIVVGVIVIFGVYVWYLYRMIKGWIYLSDHIAMQNF